MRYELKNVMVTSYSTSGSAEAEDSFDFTAAGEAQEVGLLLPAVQAAKEAARSETSETGGDAFDFKAETPVAEAHIGLLLPAVQTAIEDGEDAALADDKHKEWIDILSMGGGAHQSSQGEAAVLDFALTGNPDFLMGNSHHDNWIELG